MSSERSINLILFNEISEIPVERLNYLLNKYFSGQSFQFEDSETMSSSDLIHCLPNRIEKKLQFDSPLFEYSQISKYENIILVYDNKKDKKFELEEANMLKLTALYYKIFFGKTICLMSFWERNLEDNYWSYHNQKIEYYPFPHFTWFLNLDEDGNDEQMDFRKFDEKNIKAPTVFVPSEEAEETFEEEIKTRGKESTFGINIDKNFINNCRFLFENVEKGIKEDEFKKIVHSKNYNYFTLFEKFISSKRFLFYNAAFLSQESLVKNIQISLPKPGDSTIYIFKSSKVENFAFRNLNYVNVVVNHENTPHFILPYYKVDQYTRQTIRFLIMFLYHVDHSSTLVDYIIIYLCIKLTNLPGVNGLDKKMLETRITNIANLFLNREIKENIQLREFILEAESIESLERLKHWFFELKELEHEDILEIFKQYLNTRISKIPGVLMNVQIVEKINDEKSMTIENIPRNFESFFEKCHDQIKPIELIETNWPVNKNFTLSQETFFQINTSKPIYICCKNLSQFKEKLSQFSWFKHVPRGFVLKGGAIIDLLCDRKPKDFDFVNIGMNNQEYLKAVISFCKKTRATDIELNILKKNQIGSLTVIRLKVNNDLIEFVNSKFTETEYLQEEFMPDQIVYNHIESKMFCNEFTLFCLNYGYVELPINQHPSVMRMSKYMSKGFSFYFNTKHLSDAKSISHMNTKIEETPKSLKSLLEREIWVIWMTDPKKTVSFSSKEDEKIEETTSIYSVLPDNNLYKDKKCRVFPTVEDYLEFIKDSKLNEYNGAIVLPGKELGSSRIPKFLNLYY